MNATKSIQWNPENTDEVIEAIHEYRNALADGYVAYKTTRKAKQRVEVKKFSNCGDLLFVAALQGG